MNIVVKGSFYTASKGEGWEGACWDSSLHSEWQKSKFVVSYNKVGVLYNKAGISYRKNAKMRFFQKKVCVYQKKVNIFAPDNVNNFMSTVFKKYNSSRFGISAQSVDYQLFTPIPEYADYQKLTYSVFSSQQKICQLSIRYQLSIK